MQEYLRNIQIVNKGLQKITEIVNKFYEDDKITFIFTADHKMSDWESHEDEYSNNTRMSLIAWGSEVVKLRIIKNDKASSHKDDFFSDWHLNYVYCHDVA